MHLSYHRSLTMNILEFSSKTKLLLLLVIFTINLPLYSQYEDVYKNIVSLNEKLDKQSYLTIAGGILIGVGAVAFVLPGVVLSTLDMDNRVSTWESMKELGYSYIGIGSASITASIPTFIVGAVRAKNIANQIKNTKISVTQRYYYWLFSGTTDNFSGTKKIESELLPINLPLTKAIRIGFIPKQNSPVYFYAQAPENNNRVRLDSEGSNTFAIRSFDDLIQVYLKSINTKGRIGYYTAYGIDKEKLEIVNIDLTYYVVQKFIVQTLKQPVVIMKIQQQR